MYLEMAYRDEAQVDQSVVPWVSLSFLKIGVTFAFLQALGAYSSYFVRKHQSLKDAVNQHHC